MHTYTSTHLVLHTHSRGIHHAVAPVPAGNLVLLITQECQLSVAARHVVIQAGQVVTTS